ncbi:MAG: hypothetical protein NW214_05545 [Pseudanabaenaceae cyanobacterium bins.39]|nr:hypothetical protein [Pseudanabaenaceae cyanobacterium bins.39]
MSSATPSFFDRYKLALMSLLIGWSIQSCQFSPPADKSLEMTIINQIRQDSPYLAKLEAIYSVNYVNYIDRRFLGIRFPFVSDDIYIRNDVASVFYGYPLDEAEIVIEQANDQRILKVKLPEPRQIAINRPIQSIETNNKEVIPLDAQGNPVDIDQYIDRQVKGAIAQYEAKNLNMTRTMTRQYFQALSDRYGLKLQLEFTK